MEDVRNRSPSLIHNTDTVYMATNVLGKGLNPPTLFFPPPDVCHKATDAKTKGRPVQASV